MHAGLARRWEGWCAGCGVFCRTKVCALCVCLSVCMRVCVCACVSCFRVLVCDRRLVGDSGQHVRIGTQDLGASFFLASQASTSNPTPPPVGLVARLRWLAATVCVGWGWGTACPTPSRC
jgi:hypothetical protein